MDELTRDRIKDLRPELVKPWTKAEYNIAIDEWVEGENKRIVEQETVGVVPLRPCQYTLKHPLLTESIIRAYASSIGDPNPLWRDPVYGRKTRWGSMILPPVGEVIIGGGQAGWPLWPKVPGWQQHPYGTEREYFKVIRPGDEFTAFDTWLGMEELRA